MGDQRVALSTGRELTAAEYDQALVAGGEPTMIADVSFWDAGRAVFRLFTQCCKTLAGVGLFLYPADRAQDAERRIRRLALEELGKAGLLGRRFDRLQQAEVGLKISRRLLMVDAEGEQSS